ncbi:peptidylprolyl isomerase [Arenibacter sp. GZD96]|uniref:peptidylprolyl isomerase n=1 Tax=Aurantibrevibacter litoralis TaxID=3106030 RepID=UPI002AFE93F6|nr:peptidylprolyl isomerase [Arenibacter sp. GZD-96]MEA1785089.1 peptidylprolyl isomerase [Arenibacter sp. GZD-96]
MKYTFLVIYATTLALIGCKTSQHPELGDGIFANIETNKGAIILKLESEKTPLTVANFVALAEGNNPFVSDTYKSKKYYDGLIFHRVIKDFMIQGGDPTGTGSGNPGYKFKDEIHDSLSHHKAGILSMANAGPTTNGSQFFITHKETPFLDGRHTVFGEVVDGMDVVDSIANVKIGERDKPITDVVMNQVLIIRNGKEAKKFDAVKIMSDYFAEEEAKAQTLQKAKDEFLAELAQNKSQAETLPSGLQLFYLTKGDGEKPKVGQQVQVFYAGFLEDGTLFDSNIEAIATQFGQFNPQRKAGGGYEAISMDYSPEARLIAGFREGLLQMKVGDKVRLYIPSHLGYGAQGAGNVIPPNADLVFDIAISGIVQ